MKSRGLVVVFLVLLLLGVGGYSAYGKELAISEERIYVEILPDGGIRVKDNIVFDFSGSFNGVYKYVSFDKAAGADITKVEEALAPQKVNSDYVDYSLVESAEKGDKGVYTVTEEDNNKKVTIYSPSRNTVKGFRINYSLHGAVNKYNDTSEFYWKFIGGENETSIRRLEIYITFPEGITKETMKLYGHGPLNGVVKILNDNTALYVIEDLDRESYVEVRCLFPTDLLPMMEVTSSEDKLQSILKEENSYIEDTHRKLERTEALNKLKHVAPGAMTAVLMLLTGASLFLLKRSEYNLYEKENYALNNYDPILLSYYEKPYDFVGSSNGFIAQLLNLVRKKILSIEYLEEEEDYKIKRLPYEGFLMAHEKRLIDFLMKLSGDKEELKLSSLKESFAEDSEGYTIISELQEDINQEAKGLGFTDKGRIWKKTALIIASALFFVLSVVLIISKVWFGIVPLVFSVAVFILSFLISVRSPEGEKAHEAYKRITEELTNHEASSPQELFKNPDRLEELMVYAFLLNKDEEFCDRINIDMGKDYDNSIIQNYLLWNIFYAGSLHGVNVRNDINEYIPSPPEGSDNSGYGGGFTSGGGGFSSGGGGGAGGF